jgi:hypothetical protein
MKNSDQFEERLRRQPLKKAPPAWRGEILAAARMAARPDAAGGTRWRQRGRVRTFVPSPDAALGDGDIAARCPYPVRALLWPHPKAWAGLAALWLVVIGLNLAAREPGRREAVRRAVPASPQAREQLRQQEQLFVELIGPVEKPVAERSKPATPPPRSQRREEILNA